MLGMCGHKSLVERGHVAPSALDAVNVFFVVAIGPTGAHGKATYIAFGPCFCGPMGDNAGNVGCELATRVQM